MQTEKVIDYITNWLKDYVQTSRTSGFVLGISGGLDSAVVSTLCAKTGLPTLCLEMPIHQAPNQISRARNHIEGLQKEFPNVLDREVDLTQVYEQLKKALPELEETPKTNLSLANSRARLRMTTLYYFAGLKNFLVAGTGNKIEDFGIGFFTKYGDGGVDISPIADLMKSEVRKLGTALNVSPEILNAQATDGLFGDNRSDEDQIGANYEELEWAMNMDSVGKKVHDFTGRQKRIFEIYKCRNRANQHKIKPIPMCQIPVRLL